MINKDRRPDRMRLRFSSRRDALAASVLVVAAVLTAIGIETSQSATAQGTIRNNEASVSILRKAQAPTDTLPAFVPLAAHGSGGLNSSTARHLGEDEAARYWAVLDNESNLCFVASLKGKSESTATICGTAAEVETFGLALRLGDQTTAVEAYLLPDSVVTGAETAGWRFIGNNVVSSTESQRDALVLQRASQAGVSASPAGSVVLEPFAVSQ